MKIGISKTKIFSFLIASLCFMVVFHFFSKYTGVESFQSYDTKILKNYDRCIDVSNKLIHNIKGFIAADEKMYKNILDIEKKYIFYKKSYPVGLSSSTVSKDVMNDIFQVQSFLFTDFATFIEGKIVFLDEETKNDYIYFIKCKEDFITLKDLYEKENQE